MAILRRSLRDIRTLSGRVDRVSLPYRAYLKISCLEMEKARKAREKASARQNITNIDARLAEIEAEKDALLKALGDLAAGVLEHKAPQSRPHPRGLKIKY